MSLRTSAGAPTGLTLAITLAIAIAISCAGAGCECATEGSEAARFRAVPATAIRDDALPLATGSDLPPAIPSLTIAIGESAVEVDNRARVESWPDAERERARAARPDDDEEWPIVRGRAALPDLRALRIDALGPLLSRAAAVERGREGSSTAPITYAIRAPARVPWRRVVQVMFTAGTSGWAEPRLVLRSAAGGEVALALPLAREPTGAPLTITITATRAVRAAIATTPLAEGCGSIHETAVDSVPARSGAIDHDALARCLDAARGAGPAIHGATLAADGTLPFGELAPVLEALRARHPALEISSR